MALLFAVIAGLIFGFGLIISGMGNPAKVLGFLDLAGKWDPSLAFVMGGAIAAGAVAFRFARQKSSTLIGLPMQLPTPTRIDAKLVLGACLFGIGWGLAGICPGPALVLLGSPKGGAFVLAMLAGMTHFEWQHRAKA